MINGHVACSEVVIPIVPLRVWNAQRTRMVDTYALLDSGSTGTFCTEHLARQLNATRKKCELTLSTIEQQGHLIQTSVVQVQVSDVNEEAKV